MIPWASFQEAGNERQYLLDALLSGWVSNGPYVEKIEAKVSDLLGGAEALAVSNGTSALMLAFQTLGVKPKDKIIVPAFCFQAAANVLLQLGAIPVFCDVDSQSWNQSLRTIKEAFNDEIKGVVVVHNYGAAAEIGPIADFCKAENVWLVEDAAEAWFSKYNGQYLGQYGDISTYSMHATKTIACGEGGIVIINQPSLIEKAKLYRSHGLDRANIQYMHILPGNNYRLSNLLAAVGLAQLEQYEEILEHQNKRTASYRRFLGEFDGLAFQGSLPGAKNELWADAILLDSGKYGIDRDTVLRSVKTGSGVDMRPGFYTPKTLPYYQDRSLEDTPVSDYISKNILVLPCSPYLKEVEFEQITVSIKNLISRNKSISCIKIDKNSDVDRELLQGFIKKSEQIGDGFRYFRDRNIDCIKNHINTLLLLKDGEAIGYGHLDREGGTVWLGIALLPEARGLKLGHTIMGELVRTAQEKCVDEIDLMVDRDNEIAKRLYLSHGFVENLDKSSQTAVWMTRHS